LVRQFRDGKREVLHGESGVWPTELITALPGRPTQCSADGKYVAFPWLGSSSLKVLEVSTRGIVVEWPMAELPSWSPDARWLVFWDRSLSRGLRVVGVGDWSNARPPLAVSALTQPVVWESIGDSFLVYRTSSAVLLNDRVDFGIPRRVPQARRVLARVHVPAMTTESIGPVVRPNPRESGLVAWSLALDESSESVLLSGMSETLPARLNRVPIGSSGADRMGWVGTGPTPASNGWDALPEEWGIWGLSLAPSAGPLAFRYGPSDCLAPAGLYDPASRQARTIAPTLASRMRALRTLTLLAAQGLSRPERGVGIPWTPHRSAWPGTDYAQGGVRPKSPLALFRWEDPRQRPSKERPATVQTLTREALRLVHETPTASLSPSMAQRLAEVELFCEYAQGNFESAMAAADRVVASSAGGLSAIDRQSLTMVRIQCLIELGRKPAALWEARRLAGEVENGLAEETEVNQENERARKQREEILQRLLRVEIAGTEPSEPVRTSP
jgi:hypothetical protein